ncbi:hypothetical protein N7523_001886 [Penicillium sp. IBT 18751x]|nr:hypothetical protein N7523_001886 [Penicillium sp. IBT 18751x]
MSDLKPERVSKRKTRDGPEEAPRKKQHRASDEVQFEDYGNGGGDVPAKSTRKYKDKFAPRPEKQYPSVNELKKRIRDVKRLLQKPNLPADARILQERALAGYEQDLADENARRERSQIISKYHFVRFLDRKAANKQLKSLERRLKEETLDSKQKEKLESKLRAARVNVNYTIYYPLTEKYIALYPKSKSSGKDGAESESDADSEQKTHGDDAKPPMWAIVEKCMEEDTLAELREGKLNIGPDGKQTAPPSAKAVAVSNTKKSKKESKEPKESKTPKDSKKPRDTTDLKKTQPAFTEDKSKYDNMNRRDRRREQAKEQAREEAKKAAARAQAGEEDSDGGFFE